MGTVSTSWSYGFCGPCLWQHVSNHRICMYLSRLIVSLNYQCLSIFSGHALVFKVSFVIY